MRARDDRTSSSSARRRSSRDLLQARQLVAAGERRVEAVEQRSGRSTPASVTRAPPRLGVREHPVAVPRRDEVERLRIGVLDPRALDVRVEVADVDELRAAVVGRGGDRARELLLAELGGRRARSGPAGRWRRARRARRGRAKRSVHRQAIVPRGAELGASDLRSGDRAVPRRGGDRRRRRAAPTQPTCASSRSGSGPTAPIEDVDVRVLADWVAELGRARDRRQARAGDDRAQARGGALAASLLARAGARARRVRSRRGGRAGCRTRRSRREVEAIARRARRRRRRSRCATARCVELVYSAGLRSAEAVGLDLGDVDFEQELVHVRHGKGAQGPRRAARRGGGAPRRALPARGAARSSRAAPRTRSSSRRAAAASTPRRCAGSCPTRTGCATRSRRTCSRAAPTCARSRSCSATRRSRRPRCTATSTRSACAVSTTTRTRDPERRAAFLALLAARRSPRTVDAYRRDLAALARAPRQAGRATRRSTSSSATSAQLRADGLAGATIARRTAAARSFFRHQQLLGARADNPAAERRAAAARRARCRGRSRPARPSG